MIDSRCGLHCTGCEYKETYDCGDCIETNGHPFHGECPVVVCCQNSRRLEDDMIIDLSSYYKDDLVPILRMIM